MRIYKTSDNKHYTSSGLRKMFSGLLEYGVKISVCEPLAEGVGTKPLDVDTIVGEIDRNSEKYNEMTKLVCDYSGTESVRSFLIPVEECFVICIDVEE